MTTALIGHTGFVGSNIARQWSPDQVFNSATIEEIRGQHFDLVVCAGTYAEKWRINLDPAPDLLNVQRLESLLASASIERLVLISTIDVFPMPRDVDERSMVDDTGSHAYGRHRRWLESRLADRFDTTILRLPGLFGPGLRKNALYDLTHDHDVDRLNGASVFQFYDVSRIWADTSVAMRNRLPLLHLATAPIQMADIARGIFQTKLGRHDPTSAAVYDCRTVHSELFGRSGPYLVGASEVIEGIRDFVVAERSANAR